MEFTGLFFKTIDLRDVAKLRIRSPEILAHMRRIMGMYLEREIGDPLGEYYTPAIQRIEDAFKAGDFKSAFPKALEFMISSIDVE